MLYDIFRVLKSRWFIFSALGTFFFLWMGIGIESSQILRDEAYAFEMTKILSRSLISESSVLSLPALAALPAAASALLELRCGAARNAIFRTGRKRYVASKLLSLLISALLAQIIGILLFVAILFALRGTFDASIIYMQGGMIAARLMATGIYACLGAALALITGASAAAYVTPMAVCYALKMVGGRFLTNVPYIDPADWLKGDGTALILVSALCTMLAIAFGLTLRKEMRRLA